MNHTPNPKHALNEEVGWRLVLNLEQRAVLNLGMIVFYGGLAFSLKIYLYMCALSRWMAFFVLQFPGAGVRGGCESHNMGAFLWKNSRCSLTLSHLSSPGFDFSRGCGYKCVPWHCRIEMKSGEVCW